MDSSPTTSSPAPAPASGSGLATGSLILGVVALVFSFLLFGGVVGLVGLALGLVHVARKGAAVRRAKWGVALSILGMSASLLFFGLYVSLYQKYMKDMRGGGTDFAKWEGVMAPDIAVTTLDGDHFKLSELKGKRVVMDFWATWCPPCQEEIPHFVQLFNQTSRNDLIIVGISSEDMKILQDFVKKQGVNYPVASAKDLPHPYDDIQSIPTTFFIDRKGVIQTVAVGYHDFAALKQNALGDDFKGVPKLAPAGPRELADASPMLKPTVLWSKNIPGARGLCVGDWESDGIPRVLVSEGLTLHVLDLTGAETSTVPLPEAFALIECGRNKQKGARLLGYNNWGHAVTVVDHSGKTLWSVKSFSGVDGAHWGDLDGDGNDELVVGMNGGGGLDAWSPDGVKLWSARLGNVWNQAIVSATRDQPARVFATEAGGSVRVYDAHGEHLATLRPDGGYYAQMSACRAGKTIQIAAINGDQTTVFDEDGKVLWTTSAIGNHAGWRSDSFACGDLKGDGTEDWAFIDGSGALILANPAGQRISAVENAKEFEAFAIASRPGKGGLLVTLGRGDGAVQARGFESK